VGLFENLLGFHLESNRASPALAILTDGHGFTLVLQRRKNDTDAYQDSFHFGFLVDDVAAVRAFHLKAREGGLVTVSDVLENGRGVLVYCRTSDGLLFEVSCPRARSCPFPLSSQWVRGVLFVSTRGREGTTDRGAAGRVLAMTTGPPEVSNLREPRSSGTAWPTTAP